MVSQVVELRQYALHPGRREELVELFDREFLESQEAVGAEVLGQFRDLDDPDRFVWLRGFPDMATRHAALSAFYGGPVWAAHRDAANATMVAFDDVLLLRPVAAGLAGAAGLVGAPRPPVGAADQPGSVVVATILRLAGPLDVDGAVGALLADAGGDHLAVLETEPAPNTFRALPVREGEQVLVRLARSTGAPPAPDGSAPWRAVERELGAHLVAPPQHLRLQPTPRSALR